MTAGIARASLRSRPAAFAGSFVAVLFATTVVSASVTVLAATSSRDVSAAARRTMTAAGVGDMAVAFLLIAIYMSIFVVAATMGTAVAQQLREFAVLRAIGARPWQIRRAVATQALAAAVPAAVIGFAVGSALAAVWFRGMVRHGLVPAEVPFRHTWVALPVVLAVAVVTSVLAAVIASLRPAGLRPARAVTESAAPRRRLGLVRTPLGLIAIAGAAALSRLPLDEPGAQAFLILLLFCCGVGLLGPRIVGPVAFLVAMLARPFGASGQLGMLNLQSQTRRFSAAIVPVVLVVAFGLTKIASHTTAEHLTGSAGPAGEVWIDYLGTALYTGFAAIIAVNTLVMITVERRRDIALLRLAGTTPGQVLRMNAWEASLIALTALVLGAGIALITLMTLLDGRPYLPWSAAAGIAGGVWLLTLAPMIVPVLANRRPPAETVKAG